MHPARAPGQGEMVMNAIEHLLTVIGEEGCEVTQAASKSLRFGLDGRNVLNPTGPTNRERLIDELNDILGAADMLVDFGVLPPNWIDAEKQIAKKRKVRQFMGYAVKAGSLSDSTPPPS